MGPYYFTVINKQTFKESKQESEQKHRHMCTQCKTIQDKAKPKDPGGERGDRPYGSGFLFGRKHHSEGSPPSKSALRKAPLLPQTTMLFYGDHGHAFEFAVSKTWVFCVIG